MAEDIIQGERQQVSWPLCGGRWTEPSQPACLGEAPATPKLRLHHRPELRSIRRSILQMGNTDRDWLRLEHGRQTPDFHILCHSCHPLVQPPRVVDVFGWVETVGIPRGVQQEDASHQCVFISTAMLLAKKNLSKVSHRQMNKSKSKCKRSTNATKSKPPIYSHVWRCWRLPSLRVLFSKASGDVLASCLGTRWLESPGASFSGSG